MQIKLNEKDYLGKWIVARNSWCANRLLGRIIERKAPIAILCDTEAEGVRKIKTKRLIDQPKFQVFQVKKKCQ